MVGQNISHYKILEKLGEGGMGEVFLAQDTLLDRKVALKFLPDSMRQDLTARKRFLREAKSAAALDHPYICKIYETGETEDKSYIALEYVEGTDLMDKLAEGPLPIKEGLQAAVEIAEALEKAHSKGIVHRDLKPSNVMLTPEGHVKVTDFGLAKQVTPTEGQEQPITTTLTIEGSPVGTVPYMAPEQLEGKSVDFRCDIFAFGILLYELVSGSNPFQSKTPISTIARILEFEPGPVPRRTRQAPQLDRIIKKCLRKRPEERYQSTQELLGDLEQLRSGVRSDSKRQTATTRQYGEERAPEQSLLTSWWVVHQTSVMVLYGLMGFALWKVKEWTSDPWSLLLFFGILSCAAVNGTLRAHLLFTARFNRKEMNRQMQRIFPWIRRCDWGFVTLLLAAAFAVAADHNAVAGLLGGVAIGYLVVF